jgi:hypothetical protein
MRAAVVGPPAELSLVAFRPAITTAFLMQNFVWRTWGHGWFERADSIDPLSAEAVKALSNVFFGISHQQESIQFEATKQYGKVLRGLRGGLDNFQQSRLEDYLIPVMLLLMHSVSCPLA